MNQQEGTLAYKVINGRNLLGDILTDRHELDHYKLRNYEKSKNSTALNDTQSIIYSL